MQKKIFQETNKILKNQRISQRYFKLKIDSPRIAKVALPGQFLQLKIDDSLTPLLRRPFSIHRLGGGIEILFEVVGEGSQILSEKRPGEYLDVIGPLGKGFDYLRPTACDLRPILVAGGMGVAPLIFLAEKLAKCKILVLIGAKTKSQILCAKDFRDLGCEVKIATDDGSGGFRGKVTDLLKKFLSSTCNLRPSTFYGCGPHPMLRELSNLSKKYQIPAQISLEEHLACGIGVCLGCAVNTKNGFQRVCKEGPVFFADEIIW